ncbi:ATP-binding protein [Candidatus Woesearchaeota archaeon]|nr:ATP-binding protein [Candidatus Woesearchaeota archaeon]
MDGLTLEEMLRFAGAHQVSEMDYHRLRQEAIQHASEFGYEVAVMDFAEPQNPYSKDLIEREKIFDSYNDRKIIFLHEHIEMASPDMLQVARSHLERHAIYGHGHGHVFLATFDKLGVEDKLRLSEPWCSSYFTRWEIKSTDSGQVEYVNGVVDSMISGINSVYRQKGRATFVLVGEEGSGKTTVLTRLNHRLHSSHYDSMLRYAWMDDDRVLEGILKGRPSTILLLDEADRITLDFHQALAENYRIIVYGAHQELPVPDAGVFRMDYNPKR